MRTATEAIVARRAVPATGATACSSKVSSASLCPETVLRCFSSFSVLLCECQGEHFGIVPVEAMAHCHPVIACDDGGPKESIADGTTGLLCAQTAAAFAAAMQTLWGDERRRNDMGMKGRRRVEEMFSRKRMGDELERKMWELCELA